MSKDLYWIWLSLRWRAGKNGVAELLSHFGSPEHIYRADSAELRFFKAGNTESLLDKNLESAYNIEKYCAKNKIDILKYGESGYPVSLMSLKNPPVVLYAKGNLKILDKRVCIGVVGTRKLTEYGRQSAYKIGYELAYAGAVVVSGLALGIDAVAACGALDAHGKTVAVLGSGVDYIYPSAHKKLAEQIVKNGLLLSEYPPLEAPTRSSFPTRNRIISGLSQGTLVVEANERSGALITAKEAILQGRDVYAIPGNINNPTSCGTNTLIKDGATPITGAADILESYRYIYRETVDMGALLKVGNRSTLKNGALAARGVEEGDWKFEEKTEKKLSGLLHSQKKIDGDTVNKLVGNTEYPEYGETPSLKKQNEAESNEGRGADGSAEALASLDKKYIEVFEAMQIGTPVSLADICALGYDSRTVMSVLTTLELKGLVTLLPGGLYIRK